MVITGKKRTLVRLAGVLAALMTVFAVAVSGSTAASAATDTTCSSLRVEGTNFGGTYFCNYGYEESILQSGDLEVWVVAGSAHNIFTRWLNTRGVLSAWVNMGGNVKANGNTSYLEEEQILYEHRNDEVLRVVGTDGDHYCNVRNGSTNSWNGWTEGHCSVWD